MKIYGLQKMTLLDYPGKVACTVFTGGCNFRCPFCHNAGLVESEADADTMSEEEFLAFLQGRKGLLDGVAVTGGEPLMQPDLPRLLRGIKELGFAVKLDTNGSYPEKLQAVVAEGLVDRVAMDIKNCPDAYGETAGINDLDLTPVRQSVDFLLQGRVDYEFRTTVVSPFHTVKRIAAAAAWIQGAKAYFLQNFVDSGHLLGTGISGVSEEEMHAMLEAARQFVPQTQLRGL